MILRTKMMRISTLSRWSFTPIFLDTGFYISLVDSRDEHYTSALEILQELHSGKWGVVYTSNFVMAESATLVAVRTKKYEPAMRAMFQLFRGEGQLATLLRVQESTEMKAWDLFFKINSPAGDRPISYVDCTNIILCQQAHIPAIVAYDAHYAPWLARIG